MHRLRSNCDPLATEDDETCDVPNPGCQVCEEGVSVELDSDGDGVSNCEEVFGCVNPNACNLMKLRPRTMDWDIPDEECEECVNGQAVSIDTDDDGVADCEEVPGQRC